jgi:hypothetical protein
VKSFFIGLLIGLLCAVAAYFLGQSKGKAGLAAAQARATQAEQRASSLEATNQLLQARALVQRAATDLEQRNFGTAGTDVQTAAKMLESVPAGADAERVAAIRAQLQEVNIDVSADVGRQRERLLDLAKQMDTLLPAPTPETETPETAPSTEDAAPEGSGA